MIQYSLPDINNLACGVIKSKLFVDESFPDLTTLLPTKVPFLNFGDGKESIDMEGGVTDIDQLDVTLAEDYSKCSEGFWHRIINGYPTKTITSSGSFSEPTAGAATTAQSLSVGVNSIDRLSGDFTADGWKYGMVGIITQTGLNNGLRFTITNATALHLTVAETLTITGAETTTLQGSNTIVRSDGGSFVTDGWKSGYAGTIAQTGSNNGWRFTALTVSASTITTLEPMYVIGAASCTLTSDPVDTDIELMFTIMEGANETFWFRGKVYRKDADTTEYFLDVLSGVPNKWVRGLKVKLTTSLQMLQNVPVIALIQECSLHTTLIGAYGVKLISLGGLVASAITLAYGATYDATLCVNNSADIRLRNSDGSLVNNWDQAGIIVQQSQDFVNYYFVNFFDTSPANAFSWYNRFANAYDLLNFVLFQFGVIPKYQYGTVAGLIDPTPANNNHRLIFDSRGSSAVTVTMDGKFTESSFVSDTPRKAKTIRVSDPRGTAFIYWYLNGVLEKGDQPPYAQFDIDKETDFQINGNVSLLDPVGLILFNTGTGLFTNAAVAVDFWNYTTNSRQIESNATDNCLTKAVAQYLYNRFQKGRLQWTRTYASLSANNGSTSSQRWNKTLVMHVISDGVKSRTFYSTEVSKNLITNKSTVVWVEN